MSSLSQPVASIQKAAQRIPGIDLLRGLCIVAVVLHHTNLRIRFNQSSFGKLLSPAADHILFWSGYYGVIVFFVISGFLITTWSLKRWGALRQLSLRQFYQMRFARIAPCLLGLLLILSILDRGGVPRFTINTQHTSLGRALLAALTFHINWLEAHTGYLPANWDVLWSLSVEEVFYVFFPLLCVLLRKQAFIIGLLCCFVLIGPFARVQTQNQLWADYGYLSCMDGIALGCLAAMVAAQIRLGRKANLALRIAGSLFCVFIVVFRSAAGRLGLYKPSLNVTMLELGTAFLLIALQQRFEEKSAAGLSHTNSNAHGLRSAAHALWRSTGFLRWFGRNSYEVYLTHMFAIWPMVIFFQHFQWSINLAPLLFLAIAAVAGILGYAVAHFYSEPLNHRLRKMWLPQKKAVAAED